MPWFRLLVIFTAMTLSSRCPLLSQEPGFEDTSIAEFFSFEPEPLRRLQFIGEAKGAVIGNGNRYAENEESWWMSNNGKSVYVAGTAGAKVRLFKIDSAAAQVNQIGSVPSKGYTAVRGEADIFHLLRVDTAHNRFRLIADVYSISQQRIVATRTLLDLPRQPMKFVTRVVWDQQLQTIAVSLNDRRGAPSAGRDLHVIGLRTGLSLQPKSDSSNAAASSLSEMIPLRFDVSGRKLFLAKRNATDVKAGSVLYEFDFKTQAIRPIGSDALPRQIPICVDSNADHAVFSTDGGYELWQIEGGLQLGKISRNRSQFSGLGRPLITFVGNGSVLAISDGTSLRLFSSFFQTDPNQPVDIIEHQLQPSDASSFRSGYVPAFLSGRADRILHFGVSTTGISDLGPSGPWMQLARIHFPSPVTEDDARHPDRNRLNPLPHVHGELTPWASGEDYQRKFNELTSRGMYPVSVFGRIRNGKMEFRGRFFDKPESVDFVSQHGATQQELKPPTMGHPVRGYREVWRYTFKDQNGSTRLNVIWTRQNGRLGNSKGRRRSGNPNR